MIYLFHSKLRLAYFHNMYLKLIIYVVALQGQNFFFSILRHSIIVTGDTMYLGTQDCIQETLNINFSLFFPCRMFEPLSSANIERIYPSSDGFYALILDNLISEFCKFFLSFIDLNLILLIWILLKTSYAKSNDSYQHLMDNTIFLKEAYLCTLFSLCEGTQ